MTLRTDEPQKTLTEPHHAFYLRRQRSQEDTHFGENMDCTDHNYISHDPLLQTLFNLSRTGALCLELKTHEVIEGSTHGQHQLL